MWSIREQIECANRLESVATVKQRSRIARKGWRIARDIDDPGAAVRSEMVQDGF
jgi:hypothetical protein